MSRIRIDHHPSRRQLAVFGLVWLAFFGIVGWIVLAKLNSVQAATLVWVVAVAVPAVGAVVPGLLRIVYLAMAFAAFPIGFVLSYTILAVVYYGVMTPTGLLMRLFGHNSMHRQFDLGAKTYWLQREQTEDIRRYFRQY